MALLPRDRRDTPAQDREARRRATSREYTTAASGTRQDTPAQQRNLNRQQTPAQGRAVGRERINREQARADEVGRRQAANPPDSSLRAGYDRAASALRDSFPRPGPRDVQSPSQNYGAAGDAGRGGRVMEALTSNPQPRDIQPSGGNPYGGATPAPRHTPFDPRSIGSGLRAADEAVTGFMRDTVGIKPLYNYTEVDPYNVRGGTTTTGMPEALLPENRPSPQINQTALGMARGVGGGQGYAIGPDGRTQFFEGTQRTSGPGNLSVMGNMGAAADEFARANAIRQQTIDSQRPQNQVTILPNTGGMGGGGQGGVDSQIQRLVRDAGSTRDPWQRAAINRQISQLQTLADRGVTQSEGAADRQNTLRTQQLRNQGLLANTMAGRGGADPYDMARAEQTMLETQRMQNPLPTEPPSLDAEQLSMIGTMDESVRGPIMADMLNNYQRQQAGYQLNQYLQGEEGATFDDLRAAYADGELAGTYLEPLMDQYLSGGGQQQETEDFSAGGLVPEMSALSFAQGGMVPDQYGSQMGPGLDTGSAMGMAAPGAGGIDMMQMEYDQYAQGAQQLGVPAIPFEEFVGLKQQTIPQAQAAPGAAQPMTGAMQGSAMSFARGGMVPPGMDPTDSSGKMIVDPNPEAPQDSIPAVIDGQRPAKLDSGEFVIPKHVVMWHGMDKLNKLIEQAEQKGQGNGTQPGSAPASPSATGAAKR